MNAMFRDRTAAGRVLSEQLRSYATKSDLLVLGLPRGGVPVAYEIAESLDAVLDVFVVRKLGVPGQEELAMGAIAAGGVRVLDMTTIAALGIPQGTIDDVAKREARELVRRERQYRGQRQAPRMTGRTVMLVDDGLATGSTMRAAVGALRAYRPAKIIVAIPVAPAEVCDQLRPLVDDLVCSMTPEPFYAVGLWYEDFSTVTDRDVRHLLAQAAEHREQASHAHA
jgi:putative phosphoribosyl transferase